MKMLLSMMFQAGEGEVARSEPQSVPPDQPLESGDRETVKLQVIGSAWAVNHVIQVLHVLGFAEIIAWTPLIPSPEPGKLMRILVRRVARS